MNVAPMLQAQPWSPEDDAELLRLIHTGMRAMQIAPYFPGRSLCSVESRFSKLRRKHGLIPEPRTDDGVPGGYRNRMSVARLAAEAAAYERNRRIDAERGCRLLKEAMDRYYANRLQRAA